MPFCRMGDEDVLDHLKVLKKRLGSIEFLNSLLCLSCVHATNRILWLSACVI